jgi:hypothetical protein
MCHQPCTHAISLDDYDIPTLRGFISLFPSHPLETFIKAYFSYAGIPLVLSERHDDDDEQPTATASLNDDPIDVILVCYATLSDKIGLSMISRIHFPRLRIHYWHIGSLSRCTLPWKIIRMQSELRRMGLVSPRKWSQKMEFHYPSESIPFCYDNYLRFLQGPRKHSTFRYPFHLSITSLPSIMFEHEG